MRSLDSHKTRFRTRALVTIILAGGLAACGSSGPETVVSASALPANGPGADYPIVVGPPYEVAGTPYTPADVLNYDEVGYLALDAEAMGYSGAHHTLPVPSYAEVTSLETGRTVLVRLERRGPMTTNHIVALSPAAMAQLGGNVETPVRVRRVNPPEEQRAMLRRSDAAPLRMDTPSSLLTVLRRRLPESGSVSLAANADAPRAIETVEVAASSASVTATEAPSMEEVQHAAPAESEVAMAEPGAEEADAGTPVLEPLAPVVAVGTNAVAPVEEVQQSPAEVQTEAQAGFFVQAAAFSNPDNARRAASDLGGKVSQYGQYYRVRTGPFATRGEAEASLANVRRAGYSDARILTSG